MNDTIDEPRTPSAGVHTMPQGWKTMTETLAPRLPAHLIAVGDNAGVLPQLHAQLAGAVDVVYIDPPYDHGDNRRGSQRRFAYTDRRQDDWAGFIRDRLTLAIPLLAPHAPIAVSIGHQRVHELFGILTDVFPEYDIVTITIDLLRAPTDRLGVQRSAEYLLIAVPPGVRLGAAGFTKGEKRNGWGGFALSGYGADRYPNQVYPLIVDETTGQIVEIGPSAKQVGRTDTWDVEAPPGHLVIWPRTREGKSVVWRVAREKALELHAQGMIRADPPHMPGNVQKFTVKFVDTGTRKRIATGEIGTHGFDERDAIILDAGIPPVGAGVPTVWSGPQYETRAGTARLEELIGTDSGFAYPKPVALIADAITACTNGKRDAVILDFFAGSGTTADAVIHLNGDGGTRRAVLVQQREGDIVNGVLLRRVLAAAAQSGRDEPVELREFANA